MFNSLGEALFALETFGELDTITSKMNKFTIEFARRPDSYVGNMGAQHALAHQCGFDLNHLSDTQLAYLESEVEKRL